MINASDMNAINLQVIKKTYKVGGKNITFEAGKLALLANGAVTISDDAGNVLLVTTGIKEEGVNEKSTWFPMVVDYQEKFYASGKIGGNRFQRREGRPSDQAILSARLIDRPIRPMFPKGMVNDTQIMINILSTTTESDLGFFGISGASLTLLMAGAPFEGPVSGVKIILTHDGKYIFDPSFEEEKTAKLNLIIAGTLDAITMVEASGEEATDEEMLAAIEYAKTISTEMCEAQLDFLKAYQNEFGVAKITPVFNLPNEDFYSKVEEILTEKLLEKIYNKSKTEFHHELVALEKLTQDELGLDFDSEDSPINKADLNAMVYKRVKKVMRKNVLKNNKRLDGRDLNEVRPLSGEVGLLPRVHGSALFRRGLTQALTVATLGGPSDAMFIDDMYGQKEKKYIHHYNFPPFSVGDVRPLRGVSRREIGHGNLAERALEKMIPSEENFPYTIRVVSEITTCNGSSSMASVCGSTMSLMHAGVPIKQPVAGVAMGMIYDENTGEYKILTDIQAQEDFLGDMDFKVARTPNGINAMQLDVKIKGLSMQVFKEAFAQAGKATDQIIEAMIKVIPTANKELSPYAPMILSKQIDVEKIKIVIGKGGETIQKIQKDFDCEISIAEDGMVTITARDQVGGNKTIEKIEELVWEPETGNILTGKVAKILDGIGAIVEFKGKSGLIHISKLSKERVAKVEDVVKEGDQVKFEVIGVDKMRGKVNLKLVEKL